MPLLLRDSGDAALPAGAWEQQEKPAENPDKRLALSKKNAAAEELESLVLALGLDAHRMDSSAEHPSREDLEAYQRAGLGSWLDAQLKTADDSIASVPASIQSFLEKRQPTLWRVVGLLERDVPHWDSDPRANPGERPTLALAQLARILTAAALVEERAGHHAQAGDLLEATWSLSRSFSGKPDLLSQLMAVAVGKLQAGALRKMSEPPVQWLDRMSGVEPWRGMLDVVEARHPRWKPWMPCSRRPPEPAMRRRKNQQERTRGPGAPPRTGCASFRPARCRSCLRRRSGGRQRRRSRVRSSREAIPACRLS